jgi:hypothetical protein
MDLEVDGAGQGDDGKRAIALSTFSYFLLFIVAIVLPFTFLAVRICLVDCLA